MNQDITILKLVTKYGVLSAQRRIIEAKVYVNRKFSLGTYVVNNRLKLRYHATSAKRLLTGLKIRSLIS